MILPRSVRKMLAVFRGGVSPVIIVISVSLGFWFGLVPGWYGFHAAVLIAVLALNVHAGLFLLSAAAGKGICLAAAPVMYRLGVAAQDNLGFLFNLFASIPIIGITDFNRYSVASTMLIGPVVGIVCGLILAKVVIAFRTKLLQFEENSESFKKWYSNRWVHLFDRLLVGKRTKDAKSLFTGKTKIVRKAGVVLAVIVFAVSAGVAAMVKDKMVSDYASSTLTRANGAEVDVDSVELSALSADISVAGVQVTDREKPQYNQVSVGKLTADASLYHLLVGKVVMDKIEISDVRFDQLRQTPGKIVESDSKDKVGIFDPNDYKDISVEDVAGLEKYFKNAKKIKQWLERAAKWLPKDKGSDAGASPEQIPQSYLDYLNARDTVAVSPRLLARTILLDKLPLSAGIFGMSKVTVNNISDAPAAAGLPVSMEIKSYDSDAAMNIEFDYSGGSDVPAVTGNFEGFDLAKVLSDTSGMQFKGGTASGKFSGTLTNELIDITLNVSINDMNAGAGGEGILGMDSKTSSQVLEYMKDFDVTIRLAGPVSEPRIAFDTGSMQDQIKQALVDAGKERLTREIDKQIGKQIDKNLGDKLAEPVKGVLEGSGDVLKGLGGLLGNKKEKQE